ncbi:MAG: UDP-N-acetylglucosamine 2-epimerase (non-hydrolyzing) [Sedimentisphaerales bacterium]|nr:UDP-N-acetylglucosamine 2-epimerase (non-hydrolyzing) [Sedimentisphaerales bacterium]
MGKQIFLSIVGTRPEAIKMAPVIRAFQQQGPAVRSILCVTAQHRQMLDQVLDVFSLVPDFDLDLMQANQTLAGLSSKVLESLGEVVTTVKPDWILAQGDTTTAFMAGLVAYYHRIPFAHVEAGLRTDDIYHPFPEEINRRLADVIASVCFAPTEWARQNLLREGRAERDVILSGNTVVDALQQVLRLPYDWSGGPLANVPREKRLVLVTAHRRESFGGPLLNICAALRNICQACADDGVHLVYPVHPNPNVYSPVRKALAEIENMTLLPPLDYLSLAHLMKRSELVITDSGGLQEEAPSLNVPVLVMRDTTERPEGVMAGVARLVGTGTDTITSQALLLLRNRKEYLKMVQTGTLYGDGHAAERIVQTLVGQDRA